MTLFMRPGSFRFSSHSDAQSMKSLMLSYSIRPVGIFLALLLGVLSTRGQTTGQPTATPTSSPIPVQERAKIESVIREYLLNNPSILREMIEALRINEEREKAQAASANLTKLRPQILNDADSPTGGNPDGDLTIVAFFDYNCGYCKTNLPMVRALVNRDKNVRVIYKELPILGPQSEKAALAALAAHRQGKYEAFHEALFAGRGISDASIKAISDRLGLDYAQLTKDMADPKIAAVVDRNKALAHALGIDGTPAYIIGTQIIPGAPAAGMLETIITEERAKLPKTGSERSSQGPDQN